MSAGNVLSRGELPAFGFAILWLVAAYAGFVLLVPAASYWVKRLQLMVAVPVCSCCPRLDRGRCTWPSRGGGSGPPLRQCWVCSAVGPGAAASPSRLARSQDEQDLLRLVRSWSLAPGARIFATPNYHLVLTYYTGVPVQNVSAVEANVARPFRGDLVIVDHTLVQRSVG